MQCDKGLQSLGHFDAHMHDAVVKCIQAGELMCASPLQRGWAETLLCGKLCETFCQTLQIAGHRFLSIDLHL